MVPDSVPTQVLTNASAKTALVAVVLTEVNPVGVVVVDALECTEKMTAMSPAATPAGQVTVMAATVEELESPPTRVPGTGQPAGQAGVSSESPSVKPSPVTAEVFAAVRLIQMSRTWPAA